MTRIYESYLLYNLVELIIPSKYLLLSGLSLEGLS